MRRTSSLPRSSTRAGRCRSRMAAGWSPPRRDNSATADFRRPMSEMSVDKSAPAELSAGAGTQWASVEPGVVGLAVVALELLERVVRALQPLGDAGPRRHSLGVPGLRLPQLAAEERLAAVEEHLLDVDL